jgi:hypothetical protein
MTCFMAYSQTTTSSNPFDGYTPSGLAPGAPVGSYALSGFENVNPYSGGLSFSLPLQNIAGRGNAAYTMYLSIEQKWSITHSVVDDPVHGQHYDFYDPVFNDFPGGSRPGYGPGVLFGRQVGSAYLHCSIDDSDWPTKTLTRFTFVGPSGTEYELRDVQTDGQPFSVGYCPLMGARAVKFSKRRMDRRRPLFRMSRSSMR